MALQYIKAAYKHDKKRSTDVCNDRKQNSCFKTKEDRFQQVAQKSWGCPIPASVQGQVGQGFEESDLVKDIAAHARGIAVDDLLRSQHKPFLDLAIPEPTFKKLRYFYIRKTTAAKQNCLFTALHYI